MAPTVVGATHASPLPATGMPSLTVAPSSTHTAAVVPVTPTASATAAPPRPAATATPVPTLALPARLAANRWKEWPVVPAITNRARQIYAQGLGRNDPHAFSKVGDCQGIKEVWLGVYDQPGLYTLIPENAGLQETIDWFAGSFNRNGFAVMGGYNARAVLQPAVADPAFCQPGESPIECEYRRHHPSLVLVSLEFYYDGRTTANYEQNLRQVLDFFIARGVLPVLATKADNMEGDESLNLTNARLALEYDLPLWNFWRAAQPLPNHGMDITRPDGFHISVDAWRERSSSALQSLDAVWRGVRDLFAADSASTRATAASASPEKTATPTARPAVAAGASTPTPAPATQVILGMAERSANATRSKGVYRLDIKAQTLTRLLDDSYQLQALSPDGRQLLVNQGRDLLLMDAAGGASTAVKLTAEFYPYGASGAAWLPDGRSVVLIAERAGQGRTVWQLTLQGGAWQRLTPPQYTPHELLPSPNPAEIFWADGGCALDAQASPLPAECQTKNWYRSGIDGSAPLNLTQMSRLLRSPDGQTLAYTYLSEKNKPVLALTTGDGGQVWTPLPEGYILDYAWSPSGRWLAAVWQERSDYSGRVTAEKLYLLNFAVSASPGGTTAPRRDEIELPVDLNGLVRWSPDGRWLLLASTENNAEGYRVNLRLVPVNGGAVTLIDGKISPSGANFVYVNQVFWLPGRAGSN